MRKSQGASKAAANYKRLYDLLQKEYDLDIKGSFGWSGYEDPNFRKWTDKYGVMEFLVKNGAMTVEDSVTNCTM